MGAEDFPEAEGKRAAQSMVEFGDDGRMVIPTFEVPAETPEPMFIPASEVPVNEHAIHGAEADLAREHARKLREDAARQEAQAAADADLESRLTIIDPDTPPKKKSFWSE